MNEVIGYISALCFGLCGLPQALLVIQSKTAAGVSTLFLILWTLGEILAIIYVFIKHGWDLPLLINYLTNLCFLSIIIYYKVKDYGN